MKRKTIKRTKSRKLPDPIPSYDEFLAEIVALIEDARSLIASTTPIKKKRALPAPARVARKPKTKRHLQRAKQ